MNRIELRDHYRLCAGLFSLINSLLVLVVSCLAIYVAEFDELAAEEGTGLLALNGLYTIFVVGLIFAVLSLIGGIVAVKSQSEGIFSFVRFLNGVIVLLMAFSVIDSIYVIRNDEIEWTSERMGILGIMLVLGILAIVIGVITFLFCRTGLRYYDRGKKMAKDVPDLGTKSLVCMQSGVSLICTAILNTSLAFLSLYFYNMVCYYDRTMVESHKLFHIVYFVLFIVGVLVMIDTLFVSLLDFLGKQIKPKLVHKIAIWENMIYLLLFVVFGVISMGQKFVESDLPDVSYIIFGFVLGAFELAYLITNYGKVRKIDN